MKPKHTILIHEEKGAPSDAVPGYPVVEPDRSHLTKPGPAGPHESAAHHERITHRAYELWEQGGRHDGQELHDWLRAEREILGI